MILSFLWQYAGGGEWLRLADSQAKLTANSPGAWPRADSSLCTTCTAECALWLVSTHNSVPGIRAGEFMPSGLTATYWRVRPFTVHAPSAKDAPWWAASAAQLCTRRSGRLEFRLASQGDSVVARKGHNGYFAVESLELL